jgi:hypothetical protein
MSETVDIYFFTYVGIYTGYQQAWCSAEFYVPSALANPLSSIGNRRGETVAYEEIFRPQGPELI